jgi:inorganic triphosphatase YgiF
VLQGRGEGGSAIHDRRSAEIELKLEIAPGDLERVKAHPMLEGLGAPKRLESVYFDTPDHSFAKAGMTLRVRSDGRKRVQTVKAADTGGAPFERGEWEIPVQADQPDFEAALATPLKKLLRKEAVRASVQPAFAVEVARATKIVKHADAEIELALDEGEARAEGRSEPLLELELELKQGRAVQLFIAAQSLFDAAPVRLSIRNKAEAGYALLSGAPEAVKAEPVALDRAMGCGEAFQTIGRACLTHFLKNERLVRRTRAEEAVHQARVGVRRLRAAMSIFGDLLTDPESVRLKAALRDLAGSLGAARDLDVTLPHLRDLHVRVGGMEPLLAELERRRAGAYDAAVQSLSSPQAARLIFDTAAWLEAGDWLTSQAAEQVARRDRPVVDFAASELDRRGRKLRKGAVHVRDLDPAERHKVRIRAKKVRYGAEFFAALAQGADGKKAAKAYVKALKPMQDALGALNDIVVAERLLHEVAAAGGEPAFAAGAAAEEAARTEKGLLKQAERAATGLAKVAAFL